MTGQEFEATVLKVCGQLQRSAIKRLREQGADPGTAEQEAPDIVQATLVDLLAFAPRFEFRSEHELMAWVYTSLRRRVADYWRGRARLRLGFGSDVRDELEETRAAVRHDHDLLMTPVLFWADVQRELPPGLFHAVDGVFVRGYRWHEVGAVLGCSWRTLQSAFRRAQPGLRDRLRPYLSAPRSGPPCEIPDGGGGSGREASLTCYLYNRTNEAFGFAAVSKPTMAVPA